jgi:23S rRNA (guanosine2251-2'-O)-methyltransferase
MEAQTGPDRSLIVYGRHPVLEALRSGRPIEEVVVEGADGPGRHADVFALARQAGVRCTRAPRAALTALAGTPHHQGVVARVAARAYASLETLLAVPRERGEAGLFLALDQIQDPGNVGNLLRTAEALGVHGAIVLRHQAAGLTGHAARAAAGGLSICPSRAWGTSRRRSTSSGEGAGWSGRWRRAPRSPLRLDLRHRWPSCSGAREGPVRWWQRCDVLSGTSGWGRSTSQRGAAPYEVRRQRAGGRGNGKMVDTEVRYIG